MPEVILTLASARAIPGIMGDKGVSLAGIPQCLCTDQRGAIFSAEVFRTNTGIAEAPATFAATLPRKGDGAP